MPKIIPLNAQDYSNHNAQQLQQRQSQDPFGVAGMDGGMGEDDEDNGAYAEMGKRENLVGSTSKKALHFFSIFYFTIMSCKKRKIFRIIIFVNISY